jgi:hypothetical protein
VCAFLQILKRESGRQSVVRTAAGIGQVGPNLAVALLEYHQLIAARLHVRQGIYSDAAGVARSDTSGVQNYTLLMRPSATR